MAPLKRETVASMVRDMIADGTLKPGGPAPSGAALARKTGYCTLTCRGALRSLLTDGTLTRGASPNARLRVATADGGTDPDAPRGSLSAALAARRHAAGLTQPQLATLLGMSVTTVGHAETGRLWQSRDFWRQADQVLGAAGTLLHMYDQHQAAAGRTEAEEFPEAPEPSPTVLLPVSVTITPDGVLVVWPDGTQTLAAPPGYQDRPQARQSGE